MAGLFFQRGGWWVLGQSVLLGSIVTCGILWRGQWQAAPAPLSITGIVLLVTGAVVGIVGFANLGANLTPFPKPTEKTLLVQHGIYRFVRHPLYTALISASLGWGLVRQSWPAILCAVALAIFLDAKARVEERALRQQFPEYSAYERRARRFIPWIY